MAKATKKLDKAMATTKAQAKEYSKRSIMAYKLEEAAGNYHVVVAHLSGWDHLDQGVPNCWELVPRAEELIVTLDEVDLVGTQHKRAMSEAEEVLIQLAQNAEMFQNRVDTHTPLTPMAMIIASKVLGLNP